MKLVILLFVSLIVAVFSEDGSCIDSSSCHDSGICDNGYCSCYSGFSGANCETGPSPICSFRPVDKNSLTDPEIKFVLSNSEAHFGVELPLEQRESQNPNNFTSSTRITFYGSPKCSYPFLRSGYLEKTEVDSSCTDKYSHTSSWSKMGSECGFRMIKSPDLGARMDLYSQTINVARSYTVSDLNGENPSIQTRSCTKDLEVYVPQTVVLRQNDLEIKNVRDTDLTTSPGLTTSQTPNSAVSVSAISGIAYDNLSNGWKITISVFTFAPFKVVGVSANYAPVSQFGDRATANPVLSGVCDSSDQGCSQKIQINLLNCTALSGAINLNLQTDCTNGPQDGICLTPTNTIQITNTIDAMSACPITINPKFTSQFLVFNDSGFQQQTNEFNKNSNAYFFAKVESQDVAIRLLTIGNSGDVYVLTEKGTQTISYTILQASKDGVQLSVDLSQLEQYLNDPSDKTPRGYTFNINIGIGYEFSSKRNDDIRGVEYLSNITINIIPSSNSEDEKMDLDVKNEIKTDHQSDKLNNYGAVLYGVIGVMGLGNGVLVMIVIRLQKRRKEESADLLSSSTP